MQKFNLVIIYTRSHSPLNMGNICNANDGDVADAEERMVKTKKSNEELITTIYDVAWVQFFSLIPSLPKLEALFKIPVQQMRDAL